MPKEEVPVVDVVAAVKELLGQQAPADNPGYQQIEGDDPRCQLGHPNPVRGKFCPECGLPTGVAPAVVSPAALEPPKPADELTPEERAARDLAHQQALLANAAIATQEVPDFQPSDGKAIVIHFVDDGFTALGHVWLRGQQIAIAPGHPRWADVLAWITLTPEQQYARYGKQYFASGPVPRQESSEEQYAAVEGRRVARRLARSAAPDETLLAQP